MEILSLKTFVRDFGNGPAVLFLHGWGSDETDFLGSAKIFSNNMRTILVDLWGFGKSEKPKEVWNSFDYEKAVFELVTKLNLKSVHVVGHSFGGKIATLFAANHPTLCKSLILVDSAGIKKKLSFAKRIKIKHYKKLKKLVQNQKLPQKVLEKYGSSDLKNSKGIMKEIFLKVVNEDIGEEFKKVQQKTLIVWGKSDKDTPKYMAKKIHKQIKNSKLKFLKGGHFPHIENFETFNNLCLNFWRNI